MTHIILLQIASSFFSLRSVFSRFVNVFPTFHVALGVCRDRQLQAQQSPALRFVSLTFLSVSSSGHWCLFVFFKRRCLTAPLPRTRCECRLRVSSGRTGAISAPALGAFSTVFLLQLLLTMLLGPAAAQSAIPNYWWTWQGAFFLRSFHAPSETEPCL